MAQIHHLQDSKAVCIKLYSSSLSDVFERDAVRVRLVLFASETEIGDTAILLRAHVTDGDVSNKFKPVRELLACDPQTAIRRALALEDELKEKVKEEIEIFKANEAKKAKELKAKEEAEAKATSKKNGPVGFR